ncbi:MAG: hypothetical protein IK090_05380 [Clostridia bacterium]|nr:hypothetical protein [Clostridia bacterium]
MLTQRLGKPHQTDDAYIDRLLSMIRDNPGSCDEIWFASLYGYPKPETHRAYAKEILPQAEKFRRAGIRVSLQISNTVGHGEYISKRDCSGLVYPGSPVRNLVGWDWVVARHSFCWRDRVFRDYILSSIEAYLPIKPAAIWFDDDFRPNHHIPVTFGCFCDDCVAAFGREYGRTFTREELVSELNDGDIACRRAFIDFTKAGLASFMTECCELINRESPETRIGLQQGSMTGFIGDTGNRYLHEVITRVTGLPSLSRPGGGAYTDHDMRAFVKKGGEIERQNRELPATVSDIRPEIENLPYVAYGKSAAGTCFESTLYLSLGATAMSFAMMMDENEDASFYRREFELFSLHRPYWEKIAETNKRSVQDGVNAVFLKGKWAYRSKIPFDYAECDPAEESVIRYIGLPLCYRESTDGVQILHGSDADRLSDEAVNDLLGKPLVTDAETVERLAVRGIDLGIKVTKIDTLPYYEQCADHPINAGIKNRTWEGRFAGKRSGYRIDPAGAPFEVVGTYLGNAENAGAAATAIFTTPAGAKWAVFGFDLWNRTVGTARRDQIYNAVEYIGGKPLSARMIDGFSALILPRVTPDGKLASVGVVNCTPGESGEYRLRVAAPEGTTAHYLAQYGKEATVSVGTGGIVLMPSLSGWNVGTLFFEQTGEKTQ